MSNKTNFLYIGICLFIGFAIGIGLEPTISARRVTQGRHLLLTVPDVRQDTDYSCGASALQAVLAYWRADVRESTLIKALHSDPENGTRPEEIIRVAQEYGLRAEMREGIGMSDLHQAWESGIPVIAAIQAWREHPKSGPSWGNDWEDGHYVVVIGMDDRNVYVEDPSLLGSRGIIPQQEFLDRWHDYAGDPPYDSRDRTYVRLGLFIEGKHKSTGVTFSPVQ